ncbi:MAG: magnesium transporter [Solobacterium sp.]|nr:magnesium transporter [Solobacterium sp.]MDY2731050.1 magnesium transporter [Erysipelotrichaceae bacterium]MDD5983576.1 magnesium transporter [Solobacterium sp.]MDD6834626.1 magnesium transporter [Solobacterium sp.]MDD6885077.1 magnesium transporter [Solobacterium sp.]
MIEKIIELLSQNNYKELKALLRESNEADVAECLNELEKEDLAIVFRLLNKDEAADIFARMDDGSQEMLVELMSDSELASIISKLYVDDAADLIEELPANLVTKVLKNTSATKRKTINEILKYPEDSAGSIMTTEYVDLHKNDTVKDAFDRIRKIGLKKETVYTCYVIDSDRHLLGVTTVKDLLMEDYETKLVDVMEENVITVSTTEDKEEVSKMFDKYDFLALPVIDSENRLVGIVTIDDAFDVMSEESEEDFEKMAAMAPSEDVYLKEPIFRQYKNRIVWLLILMLSSIVTGKIITNYESAFASVPLLVSFIPMIMDTGGNCGSQASTMIIRALATDEIETRDVFKAWWKEIRIALLVGVTLGIVNGARIALQYHDLSLALVIAITLMFTACIAKSLGCLLPIGAKALKLDPAYMASPMITTIVDACSLAIYFNIALVLMNI